MTVPNDIEFDPIALAEAGKPPRISRADFIWYGGVALLGQVGDLTFVPDLQEDINGEVTAQTGKVLALLANDTADFYKERFTFSLFARPHIDLVTKFALEEDNPGYKTLYVASNNRRSTNTTLTSQVIGRATDGSWLKGEHRTITDPEELIVQKLRLLGKPHLDAVLDSSYRDVLAIQTASRELNDAVVEEAASSTTRRSFGRLRR